MTNPAPAQPGAAPVAGAPAPIPFEASAGLSDVERQMGVDQGLIEKPSEEKPAPKIDAKPEEKAPAADGKAPETPEKKDETPAGGDKKPDEPITVQVKDPLDEIVLTPDQQKLFDQLFPKGTPVSALRFREMKQRGRAQKAESERDAAAKRAADLEKELADLRSKPAEPAKPAAPAKKEADDELGLDDLLEDKKPEEKAGLTDDEKIEAKVRAAQEKIDKEKEEKRAKEDMERSEKAEVLKAKHAELEEDAKAQFPDWETVAELGKEVLENAKTMFANDPAKLRRIIDDGRLLMARTIHANAPELKDEERHAAIILYEIGQQHPKYKPANAGKPSVAPDGGLSADKLKKVEKNLDKRPAASVNGGGAGSRPTNYDDLTKEELAKMPQSEFNKVPKSIVLKHAG